MTMVRGGRVTSEGEGATRLLPAPVDAQVLPNGHQQTGGPVFPDALVSPRRRRPLQLLIPGLQGEAMRGKPESGRCWPHPPRGSRGRAPAPGTRGSVRTLGGP